MYQSIFCHPMHSVQTHIQYTAVSAHNTVKPLFCGHSIGWPPLFNVLSFYNISDSWIIFRNSACSYHLNLVQLALLYSLILQSLKLQPEQLSFNPLSTNKNTERHLRWWISKIVKNSNTMVVVTEGSENSRLIYSKIEPRENVRHVPHLSDKLPSLKSE